MLFVSEISLEKGFPLLQKLTLNIKISLINFNTQEMYKINFKLFLHKKTMRWKKRQEIGRK